MRNIRLTFSYDGTDFQGWQTQPAARTVQETLETALAYLTRGERVRLTASGRTDAGVHAVAQVANFFTAADYPAAVFMKATNTRLPPDLIIHDAAEAPQSFDSGRDAKRKLYRYVIHNSPSLNLFTRKYAYHYRGLLDAAAMRRAASALLGRHDFRCFETEWPNRRTSVRTITHAAVSRAGEAVWIDVEADGFLYNMVRAIAGSLVEVGRGYWPETKLAELIAAGDRRLAGPTAPAHGLFLMRVSYDP